VNSNILPAHPQIYHITHVENLTAILADGGLRSDATMIQHGGPTAPIGMGKIKERRLRLSVPGHPGDHVGDYVPFYFCPRSIMLYLIHCANHSDLSYRGGQGPIVHLEADLRETVAWAEARGHRWAFSLSNAGASYTEFRNRWEQLAEINWTAVAATDFRDTAIKEGKQAEFLIQDPFPWSLVRRIGVHSAEIQRQVLQAGLRMTDYPSVEIRRDWYF